MFEKLKCVWTWHVIDGAAAPEHCTQWCARIEPGLSTDGTAEYMDQLQTSLGYDHIRLYRKSLWAGKIQMFNTAMARINEPSIVLEVDSDEIWTAGQIEKLVQLFEEWPDRNCAYFRCRYFVGPDIVITSRNTYGGHDAYEWHRAWKLNPGDRFERHEPPVISNFIPRPFTQDETEDEGLVFDHFAYATEKQVAFKEQYYKYPGAVEQWKKLQANTKWPARLGDFLFWVKDDTICQRL